MSASSQPSESLASELEAALAREFKNIVEFSGAVMAANSVIPTFRSGVRSPS